MGRKRSRRPPLTGHELGMVLAISVLSFQWGLTPVIVAQTQTSVQQLFEEAQAARTSGNLEQAARAYLEVIRQDPRFVNAYQNLGIVYLSQRRYQDAISVLEKAIRLDPRLAGAYVVMGLAHYELSQPQHAVTAFERALRLNPSDRSALLFLGKAQMQMGNDSDAAGAFEKLRQTHPNDADVLYNLSLARLKLFLKSVDQLRGVAPQSYRLALLEAQDAEGHNDDAAAIQSYKEALGLKPDLVGVHYSLGCAYARASKYEEAVQEFKKELVLNPNDPLALWRLGEITLHNNASEAQRYLGEAVSLNPEFPQAVLAYGRALLRTGETEKAIEQFHRVVELAPEEDTVHYLLANAYRKLGRQAESQAEVDKFQELARAKSAQRDASARELVTSATQSQDQSIDIEPGFSRSREPAHP